jgi:polar amino acid transport system substrate-binding protein
MKKRIMYSAVIHLCCLILFVVSGSAFAKDLKLASSTAVPPYIIVDTNSGIELDVVREVLGLKGYTVTFEHLPFPRAVEKMKAGEFDGALTISQTAELELGNVFYSDSHITFQNVAISLKSSHLNIEKISDLSDKAISTFQYARQYIGPEFAKMADSNPAYRELPNSSQIVPMLFQKRVQTIVMEINIFKYLLKEIKFIDTSTPVVIHEIFPKNPFKVVFLDSKVRNDFNQGLKMIRANGRYNEIINKYIQ